MNRAHLLLGAVLWLSLSLSLSAQRGGNAPKETNPLRGNQQAVMQGRELYNRNCTTCHGYDGAAGEIGPALGLPGRRSSATTGAEIFNVIQKGIAGTQMPPFPRFSENEIWQITAYVQGLRGTAIDVPSPGDAARGEQIFWGKGQCGECHMVRGKGGLVGPELTNIADTRKTATLVDSLTNPQFRMAASTGAIPRKPEPLNTYQPVRITTADGKMIRGVLKNEDSFSLQILGLDEKLYLLQRAGLKEVQYEQTRLMPSDYNKRLTPEEFQNLMAFLTRLGSTAEPQQAAGTGAEVR